MEKSIYPQEIIPELKKMKINSDPDNWTRDVVKYPVRRSNTIRSSINNLHLQFQARYKTKKEGSVLIVKRVEDAPVEEEEGQGV